MPAPTMHTSQVASSTSASRRALCGIQTDFVAPPSCMTIISFRLAIEVSVNLSSAPMSTAHLLRYVPESNRWSKLPINVSVFGSDRLSEHVHGL